MRPFAATGLGLLILAAAACGAYRFPGGPGGQTGTVTGTVTVSVCYAIQPQQDQPLPPCKQAPAQLTLRFAREGDVKNVHTDQDGAYSITLASGTWKVAVDPPARITAGPTTVDVPAGGSIEADYVVDTGIRVDQVPATAPG
jgi:hypothetical protein